jgi:hypothetical protein
VRLAILRRTGAYTVVVLGLAALVVACADEPVSPLAVDPPPTLTSSPVPSPTISPSRRPPAPRRTTRATTPLPTGSSACPGPVIVTVAADDELAQTSPICLEVGGVLRIEVAGPDSVSVDRPELVDQVDGAGVVEIHFLSPGAFNVTIIRGTQTFVKPVVVG